MLPSHGTGARFILYELCLSILFVSLRTNAVVLSVIILMRFAIVVLNTRSNLVIHEGFDSPLYLLVRAGTPIPLAVDGYGMTLIFQQK